MKKKNQKYLDEFGKHLKTLIKAEETTPEAVAARGDIETKQVYRVINAEHDPTLSTIVAIAKGLDIHTTTLFNFDLPIQPIEKKK
ncbi:MAG TPA: helix-turn-helix transcriptional regulator [Phnomibacter sp.]|nr:helix-turn-helix transcriptional regulator [Phnomibacter sp.]